jgi:hypothetical protein
MWKIRYKNKVIWEFTDSEALALSELCNPGTIAKMGFRYAWEKGKVPSLTNFSNPIHRTFTVSVSSPEEKSNWFDITVKLEPQFYAKKIT